MGKDFVFAGFIGVQSGHCDDKFWVENNSVKWVWKVMEEIEKRGGQMRVGGEETPNKHTISVSLE